MPRLCLILLLTLLTSGLSAQERFKAEYWEKNWRDWPRPEFDYSYPSFTAVENIVLREFFSSNSNNSGELYFHYVRFQYPDQASIDNWSKVVFSLPNYANLKDIDFRIWEGDVLLYEARAASIRERFLDTLSADPHTGKLFAFSLAFPELKPGHIVELMISLDGTPLPYHLGFHQSFPIARSVQRIKITSAYPLQFSASPGVKTEEKRIFENKFYSFESSNCQALSPELGLSTMAASLPMVWIDWLDQVFFYDREESRQWKQVIDNLFYQGALRDYAVYRNSLDYEFGLQQYYGSWIRPVRYFHERPSSLNSNQANAEGRWRLSRSYAERWLWVEEKLDLITDEQAVPNFQEALGMIYESQRKASKSYLRFMPVYPPVFTEYGLLCSHYETLLKHYNLEYRLALFYPQRSGRPDANYPSPWPAFARGIAYRANPNSNWTYIFPGPYFGQFLKPGEIPPDFEGGSALLFERGDSLAPHWEALPPSDISQHGIKQHYHLRYDARTKRFTQRDTLFLEGNFQSILASAYLREDSAADQLSFTNHQLITNALRNDSIIYGKTKNFQAADTLSLSWNVEQARTLRGRAFNDRDYALPMAFCAQWQWRITGVDSLEIDWPSALKAVDNPFYALDYSLARTTSGDYLIRIKMRVKKAFVPKEEYGYYMDWYQLLEEENGLQLRTFQIKEPEGFNASD